MSFEESKRYYLSNKKMFHMSWSLLRLQIADHYYGKAVSTELSDEFISSVRNRRKGLSLPPEAIYRELRAVKAELAFRTGQAGPDSIAELPVGLPILESLIAAGYSSLSGVASALNNGELREIEGIGPVSVEKILTAIDWLRDNKPHLIKREAGTPQPVLPAF